jgi:hypothetical protein
MKDTTLLVLYDPRNALGQYERARAERPGQELVVLPLDYEIALTCADRGIPYLDLLPYHRQAERALWADPANRAVSEWYRAPEMRFFSYRGEMLGRAYEWSLLMYLLRILYYTDLTRFALRTYGTPRRVLIAPLPPAVLPTAAALAQFDADAPVRVVEHEVRRQGISVDILSDAARPERPAARREGFARLARGFANILFRCSNAFVEACTRPRGLRIYTSEYWKNIASFMPLVPDAEATMMDRRDARALLPLLTRLRVRFLRPEQFVSGAAAREIESEAERLRSSWRALSESPGFSGLFRVGDIDAWPLIRPALEHCICADAPRLLSELIGSEALFAARRINRVFVRASVSAQTHFYALAVAARWSNIPCVELQHGLAYYRGSSIDAHINTEYFAGYGPAVARDLAAGGFPAEKVLDIGSPRFDQYLKEQHAGKERNPILCIVPIVSVESFSTYDLSLFIEAIGKALVQLEPLPIVFKLRTGGDRRELFERIAAGHIKGEYRIVSEEPVADLLGQACLALSPLSTVALEALLSDVPLVLVATHPIEGALSRDLFSDLLGAGGAGIGETPEELAQAIARTLDSAAGPLQRAAAQRWLKSAFNFDGRSSERMAQGLAQLGERRS